MADSHVKVDLSPREVGTLLAALGMLLNDMEADGDDFLPGANMTGGGQWSAMTAVEVGALEERLKGLGAAQRQGGR